MLGKVILLTGGMIQQEFVREYISQIEYDTVVCADAGLEAAYALQLKVDYVMGDFDSVSREILQGYRTKKETDSCDIQFMQYPVAKDYTDTQMALEWIVKQGADTIWIFGATGGRLDHFLSNVNVLMKALEKGIPAYIIDACNRIRLLDGKTVLSKKEAFGKYVSLQPLSEKVYPVTLQGFQYPLTKDTLSYGDGRAISNEFAPDAEEGIITFSHGILILIESKDM